jgi:hypothetical protein
MCLLKKCPRAMASDPEIVSRELESYDDLKPNDGNVHHAQRRG